MLGSSSGILDNSTHGSWRLILRAHPKVWVEKTLVDGRADRREGAHALGRALWSPLRAQNGADIYRNMRLVQPGDIILHLTDNTAFTGWSIADNFARTDFIGISGTSWAGLPCYRIPLRDFIQAIYKGRERPVCKQLGIEASGRTTVLKVNYRNTAQIVAFARRFASDVIGAPGTTADDEHAVLLPEDAGRQGLVPEVRQCVSIDAEAHCIAEWFLGQKKAGYEWPQMACLYPEHWIGERVAQVLAKHGVPIDMAKNNRNRVSTKRVAVRLLSMHTAKGPEFPCVAIAGLGLLGRHGEPMEECVRLTYVGVTRATHEALLTHSSESALVQRLIA